MVGRPAFDHVLFARASSRRAGFTTGRLFGSPGEQTLSIEVDSDFPFVTLVSMIGPTPDWFVGVSALSLRDKGAWVETLSVDLFPYDAGSDSGDTELSSNP